jgi:hypothetical protein
MPELAFLTLFLGLVSGVQPVAVSVVGDVARLELILDGKPFSTLEQPPWRATVDFGPQLLPHTLSARALDAEGKELARTVQWINLPRPAAEVELQLERDPAGVPRAARLVWQNLTGEAPQKISVSLDGRPLARVDRRVELPAVDPTLPHVLSAELRFGNGVVARRDAAFGGDLGTELRTEITAVPVRLPGRPKPEATVPQNALLLRGAPAAISASELGAARLVVVRDPTALAPLLRLLNRGGVAYGGSRGRLTPSFPSGHGPGDVPLDPQLSLRFLWPQAAARGTSLGGERSALKLFDGSREFGAADGGLFWLLTHVLEPGASDRKPQIADALAVAGLQALGGNGRRAVLLLLGSEPDDPSQYEGARIVEYLRAVHVPLFVWRLEHRKRGGRPSPWGEGEYLGTPSALAAAAGRLDRELSSQRVAWIDGAHAPSEIALAPAALAAGLRFAGEDME